MKSFFLVLFVSYTINLTCSSCGPAAKAEIQLFTRLLADEGLLVASRVGGTRIAMRELEAISVSRYGGKISASELKAIYSGKMSATELKAISQRFENPLTKAESEVLYKRFSSNKIIKFSKTPRGWDLGNIMNPVQGSSTAKNAVKSVDLEFTLYNSRGEVMAFREAEETIIYTSAKRAYEQKLVNITDDSYNLMKGNSNYTESELRNLIEKSIKNNLAKNANVPYKLDITTGDLTLNVEYRGSQIVGTTNIYRIIKNGLIAGGGYYTLKKI